MNGEETEGLNTMPLDLSTLANLGRTASYGVRRYAQAREENSERELAKDWMRASVTADYGDIINKLNQGYYRNARPELLNRAGQSISQGLRLKRAEAARLRAEEREDERYNREQAARLRAEERETKRHEDKLAADRDTRQRQKAIDIHNITRDIVSEHNGRITRKDAWPLAAERYEAIMAGEYTPTPPTGKTLIEQKFEDLPKFRGEELETKKKELAKDIRESHYDESITHDDYEKYMRQLQGYGQGAAFGLGRAAQGIGGFFWDLPSDIMEGFSGFGRGFTQPSPVAPTR